MLKLSVWQAVANYDLFVLFDFVVHLRRFIHQKSGPFKKKLNGNCPLLDPSYFIGVQRKTLFQR